MGASWEWNKRNLTLTLTLNLLLPSLVFYNKFWFFIMIYTALSFLRLTSGLFLRWGGNVSWLYVKEWSRLDIDIRKSDSISIFKKRILSFKRPLPNKVSNSHYPQRLKLLTRLRLGFSHLRYHKIKHNFWIASIHTVAVALISKQLFIFFYCPNFIKCRNTLLSKISEINSELITRNDLALIETLLSGDNSFSQYDNSRFDNPRN